IPYFQLPLVVAFTVVGQAQDVTMIALALVLLGMVGGANSTLPNAFWAEFYGTRHLGAIKALATAIMVLGSAIGPAITGFGLGLEISLSTQFQYVAIYFACTSIAMMVGVLRFGRATPITR
ncbi:MAG: MFS transporter, partial [Paracoccaceae bacterium]